MAERIHLHQFEGRRQKPTPVVDAETLILILQRIPGCISEFTAKTAVQLLGGDLGLIEEVKAFHEYQQSLPQNHPARIFGEFVEAKAVSAAQLKDNKEWHQRRAEVKEATKEKSAMIKQTVPNANPGLYRNINGRISRSALGVFPSQLRLQIAPEVPKSRFNSRDYMIKSQICLATLTESLAKDKAAELPPMSSEGMMAELNPILDWAFEAGKIHNLHGKYLTAPPPKPVAIAEQPAPQRIEPVDVEMRPAPTAVQQSKILINGNVTMHNYFHKI